MAFFLQPFTDAAKKIEIEPITAEVHNAADIESAVAALGAKPGSGLIVTPDNFTAVHRELFVSLAAQFRIPTIYPYRYYAEAAACYPMDWMPWTCSSAWITSAVSFAAPSPRIFRFRRRPNSKW